MTDEDIFVVHVIDSTVSGSLKLLFVALEEDSAATVNHLSTFTVDLRTVNFL